MSGVDLYKQEQKNSARNKKVSADLLGKSGIIFYFLRNSERKKYEKVFVSPHSLRVSVFFTSSDIKIICCVTKQMRFQSRISVIKLVCCALPSLVYTYNRTALFVV